MKPSSWLFGLCCFAVAGHALAEQSATHALAAVDPEPRFMIYFQQFLGSAKQSRIAPRFGFSIERAAPLGLVSSTLDAGVAGFANHSVRMLDVRFSTTNLSHVWLNGYKLSGVTRYGSRFGGDSGGSYGEGSFGEDSWNNPWVWFAIGGAAAVGLSCATDNWPCTDNYRARDRPPEYQIPGGE